MFDSPERKAVGNPPPPPPKPAAGQASQEEDESAYPLSPLSPQSSTKFKESILQCDGASILQLIAEEVGKIDYKPKSLEMDYERIRMMVEKMHSILTHDFLKVNLDSSINRSINATDWSSLCACQRSESGSVGIYFLQCRNSPLFSSSSSKKGYVHEMIANSSSDSSHSTLSLRNDSSNNSFPATPLSKLQQQQPVDEIIVGKPYTSLDYEKTFFVSELATNYFQIKTPKIRYLDRNNEEFSELEEAVKSLFSPLFHDLYEVGGSSSPKDLFSSKGIMFVEYLKATPLSHRMRGQRSLSYDDYYEIGKIFLFDLIIRNTDRFPCCKALPRPTTYSSYYNNIMDHGNPGNILFGKIAGEVWSIDPEMQTNIDETAHDSYGKALISVVKEVLFRQDLDRRFKSIETLFFSVQPPLEDILPVSLNELKDWENCNSIQKNAISSILQLIRLKLENDSSILVIDPTTNQLLTVPSDNSEKDWREWIRMNIPRVMADLFQFFEINTGYTIPYYAYEAFYHGFCFSLQSAIQFKQEYYSPSNHFHKENKHILEKAASKDDSIDISFVLDMIEKIEPLCHEINRSSNVRSPIVPSKTYSK
jgi:hypothetical protein